jgi:hypothetical protein
MRITFVLLVKEEPLTETVNNDKENEEEEEEDSSEDDDENIEVVLHTENTNTSGTNLNKNYFRTPINIQAGILDTHTH